jgi:hypothetical protein
VWLSEAFAPDRGIKDRNENGGVVINWKTMYRPLTSPSEGMDDMELKVDGSLIAHIKTGNLVPYEASADWVLFKMELTSTSIRVYMDHDGNGYKKYVDDVTYGTFRKLHFQYKTDTNPLKNFYIYIVDITFDPIP